MVAAAHVASKVLFDSERLTTASAIWLPPSVDPAAGWGIAPSDGAVLAPVAAPAGGGGEALVDKWAAK